MNDGMSLRELREQSGKTRPIPRNGNERNISCGAGKPRRKGY